ncbi:MAG: hypothetical protein QM500_19460, partial [Methylococcales bacterium]
NSLQKALDEKGLYVGELFEDYSEETLIKNIKELQSSVQKTLSSYGEYIKLGIKVLTIDCYISGDVNEWDMDNLATIGMNLSQEQTFDAHTLEFDMKELIWQSKDGLACYAFSRETGLPTF